MFSKPKKFRKRVESGWKVGRWERGWGGEVSRQILFKRIFNLFFTTKKIKILRIIKIIFFTPRRSRGGGGWGGRVGGAFRVRRMFMLILKREERKLNCRPGCHQQAFIFLFAICISFLKCTRREKSSCKGCKSMSQKIRREDFWIVLHKLYRFFGGGLGLQCSIGDGWLRWTEVGLGMGCEVARRWVFKLVACQPAI